MELIKGYDIQLDNYSKKTPVVLRKVADILLATILVVDPILQTQLPDFDGKNWVIFGWSCLVVLFKLFTKTVTQV